MFSVKPSECNEVTGWLRASEVRGIPFASCPQASRWKEVQGCKASVVDGERRTKAYSWLISLAGTQIESGQNR